MLQLVYLPVNDTYVFIFGEHIATAQIVPMGDHPRFGTRDEQIMRANRQGLWVKDNGEVIGI